ncbi:MAG: ClpXP protease specificity-enhancing factor [Burkholderiales bacterium 28-67-8]|nr:MAG: ClpXP protease specificity-enhancing factor [Burkholderiales bacterium 28-67-8]
MKQTPEPPSLGQNGTSTRPYLIRALHEWCTDNGFTPYIAVFVDANVKVPMEYVKNGEIVLNVGFEATTALELGNELIEFKARFGGSSRDISVPVDHVIAIYARENGQGMAFPVPSDTMPTGLNSAEKTVLPSRTERGGAMLRLATDSADSTVQPTHPVSSSGDDSSPEPSPPSGRPSLTRIK